MLQSRRRYLAGLAKLVSACAALMLLVYGWRQVHDVERYVPSEWVAVPSHRLLFCCIPGSECSLTRKVAAALNRGSRPLPPNEKFTTPAQIKEKVRDPSWRTAVFLRNPFDRLLAGWLSACAYPRVDGGQACVHHQSDPRTDGSGNNTHLPVRGLFNRELPSSEVGFADFVRDLHRTQPDASHGGDMFAAFAPQDTFCGGLSRGYFSRDFAFDFVGYFESNDGLLEAWRRLGAWLGAEGATGAEGSINDALLRDVRDVSLVVERGQSAEVKRAAQFPIWRRTSSTATPPEDGNRQGMPQGYESSALLQLARELYESDILLLKSGAVLSTPVAATLSLPALIPALTSGGSSRLSGKVLVINGANSTRRRDHMKEMLTEIGWKWRWVVPPVLNGGGGGDASRRWSNAHAHKSALEHIAALEHSGVGPDEFSIILEDDVEIPGGIRRTEFDAALRRSMAALLLPGIDSYVHLGVCLREDGQCDECVERRCPGFCTHAYAVTPGGAADLLRRVSAMYPTWEYALDGMYLNAGIEPPVLGIEHDVPHGTHVVACHRGFFFQDRNAPWYTMGINELAMSVAFRERSAGE